MPVSKPAALLDRRRFIQRAAIGATALSGLAVRPGSVALGADPVTLALDWYPNANHAGIYVARETGGYAAAGLDVDVYTPSDPTVVLQTVGAGKDTFGISYQTDVLLARAQSVPVVSVAALVQRPLLCVMSLVSAGIERPADLKGKTVGYPGIPSQEAILATMLETDGLALSDVDLVNVEFNLLPAVVSGKAAAVMGAYWTHETIIAEREGYAVNAVRVEDWGVPPYYELVIVASEETVTTRPELVRAFLAATVNGYVAAAEAPEAAVETLLAAYPEMDREVETAGLALLVPAWTDDVEVFGEQSESRWLEYGTWMKSRGLIPAELDTATAFTADLLPKTEPPAPTS